jgi:hypothetical protein
MDDSLKKDSILILDFGSQVTQLIARRIRESGVYCQILPFSQAEEALKKLQPKGMILSGGPSSVMEEGSIWQYTPLSLILRAISWVTWLPKSKIRIESFFKLSSMIGVKLLLFLFFLFLYQGIEFCCFVQ